MNNDILKPVFRPRRLRNNTLIRELVKETKIQTSDLIYPMFITENSDKKEEIPSMPNIYRFPINQALEEIQNAKELGIRGVLLFGIPSKKDSIASSAYDDEGVVQKAVREIKKNIRDMLVITDVCCCEYTDHGHCGIVKNNNVSNDDTLDVLSKIALSHAKAGADLIAPSDMMDGRVRAIRHVLDNEGFENLPIMAYSAKFSSSFYSPFRDAAQSTPQFGDRKGYQLDYSNSREAIYEAILDMEEGADIIMIKPAMVYMDIIAKIKAISNIPIATYNVSGEYSMVKAAVKNNWINEKSVVLEILTGLKRAGADIIITYHALDAAYFINMEF